MIEIIKKIANYKKESTLFGIILTFLSTIYWEDIIYRISAVNYYKIPIEYFKLEKIERGIFIFRIIIVILIVEGAMLMLKEIKFGKKDSKRNKFILKGLFLLNKIMISFLFTITTFMSIIVPMLNYKLGNGRLKNILMGEYSEIIFWIIYTLIFILIYRSLGNKKNRNLYFKILFLLIMMAPTVYKVLVGVRAKTRYEIVEIDNKQKAILSNYNGKYLIVDCKIETNEVFDTMENLILDTSSFEFVEMTNKKIKYRLFKKIIIKEKNGIE